MIIKILPFLFFKNFVAIAIYPFIFLRYKADKNNKVLINHENIHLKQQKETLFVLFFVWYFLEFFIKLFKYKFNSIKAYRNISFEREAYENQLNSGYLKIRKIWSFLKYL